MSTPIGGPLVGVDGDEDGEAVPPVIGEEVATLLGDGVALADELEPHAVARASATTISHFRRTSG
jgi:hypothetical protein